MYQQANRQEQRANVYSTQMSQTREEIKRLERERRARRRNGIALLVVTTMASLGGVGPQYVREGNMAIRELRIARQAARQAHERQIRLRNLEYRLQKAMDKARIFMQLSRRASGGYIYAKHQAEFVAGTDSALL